MTASKDLKIRRLIVVATLKDTYCFAIRLKGHLEREAKLLSHKEN